MKNTRSFNIALQVLKVRLIKVFEIKPPVYLFAVLY